jgi:hypothetical protein
MMGYDALALQLINPISSKTPTLWFFHDFFFCDLYALI